MTTKAIIALEKGNTTRIILLKEGVFWKAYNFSAFLFCNYIQAFKVTKRRIKKIDAEVVYLGFPTTIFGKIQEKAKGNFKLIVQEDKRIEFEIKPDVTINLEDYYKWLDAIKTTPAKKVEQHCKNVFHKIKEFPILHKTPIESQLFLANLQQEINGII